MAGGKCPSMPVEEQGIPSMIYYPVPVHHQEAYRHISRVSGNLDVSTRLCESVLSLPIHTEMSLGQQQYITETLKKGGVSKLSCSRT